MSVHIYTAMETLNGDFTMLCLHVNGDNSVRINNPEMIRRFMDPHRDNIYSVAIRRHGIGFLMQKNIEQHISPNSIQMGSTNLPSAAMECDIPRCYLFSAERDSFFKVTLNDGVCFGELSW